MCGSSSICCDVLRMHLSDDLPAMEMPGALFSVDECADVERTNWRTCFCCAVKNVDPCDVTDVSGCCRKLVNLLFVPVATDAELLLLLVIWVVVNFCVTILTVDWALSCCISDAVSELAWSLAATVVDVDCKLWLRAFCVLIVFTLTAVPVECAVAVDVVVVVDMLSSSSSIFSSPGAVTMYWGGSDSSTDIFFWSNSLLVVKFFFCFICVRVCTDACKWLGKLALRGLELIRRFFVKWMFGIFRNHPKYDTHR